MKLTCPKCNSENLKEPDLQVDSNLSEADRVRGECGAFVDVARQVHLEAPEPKEPVKKDLKQVALDIHKNLIFTSHHLKDHETNLIPSIFMPIALGALRATPILAKCNDAYGLDLIEGEEYVIVDKEADDGMMWIIANRTEIQVALERFEITKHANPDVGMVYEYYSKALPRSINGCPIFTSCHVLTVEEADKVDKMVMKLQEHEKQIEELLDED